VKERIGFPRICSKDVFDMTKEGPIASPLPAIAGKEVSEDGNGNVCLNDFGRLPEDRSTFGRRNGIAKKEPRPWKLRFWKEL
jgi:hypothetical protein